MKKIKKRNNNAPFSYSDIFRQYAHSVIPIGWAYTGKLSETSFRKETVLTGKWNGEDIHVMPCATAFLIYLDSEKARFVTASHAFPDAETDAANITVLILNREASPSDEKLTLADLSAYPGALKYDRLEEQDICIFDIKTPEELFNLKPTPIPLGGNDYCVGDPVCTIGYPFLGYDDLTREMRFVERLTCAHLSAVCVQRNTVTFEFDNYVGPGNSGGPLINVRTGCAIGTVNWIRTEGEHGMTTFSNATSVLELVRSERYFHDLRDFCSLCANNDHLSPTNRKYIGPTHRSAPIQR